MESQAQGDPRVPFGRADEDRLLTIRRIGRAFADIGRVRMLAALRDKELCVCHLASLLGLDPVTVQRHIKLLAEAGLVITRKQGRWTHCRRANPRALLWQTMDELGDGAGVLDDDATFLARVDRAAC